MTKNATRLKIGKMGVYRWCFLEYFDCLCASESAAWGFQSFISHFSFSFLTSCLPEKCQVEEYLSRLAILNTAGAYLRA